MTPKELAERLRDALDVVRSLICEKCNAPSCVAARAWLQEQDAAIAPARNEGFAMEAAVREYAAERDEDSWCQRLKYGNYIDDSR
jgi:hypothetical protein